MKFPIHVSRPWLVLALISVCLSVCSAPLSFGQAGACASGPCVATYHNDAMRDGVNSQETTLTPSLFPAKGAANFGLLVPSSGGATGAVDGMIYAQPLYLSGVNMVSSACTGSQNIVLVATANNSIYAFTWNYSTTSTSYSFALTQCWMLNLNQPGEFATPYTAVGVKRGVACNNTLPQLGIVSTPVVDTSVTPPVLYAVTADQTATKTYTYRLHAINVSSGAELTNGSGAPYDLSAIFAKTTSATYELQRPGLALFDGGTGSANIYVSFGSFCDVQPYSGYVAGLTYNYSTQSFSPVGTNWVFDTENGSTKGFGGIWMGGGAPAVDSAGNVYLAVGNGLWNGTTTFGQSVVKLATTSSGLSVADYYTPNVYSDLNQDKNAVTVCSTYAANACPTANTLTLPANSGDYDLGSAGITLIAPAGLLTPPCGLNAEMVLGGKEGVDYGLCYSTQTGSTPQTVMGGLDGCGYNCTNYSNPTISACTESTQPGNGAIAQCFQGAAVGENQANGSNSIRSNSGVRGTQAFWAGTAVTPQNYLYTAGISAALEAYQINPATGLFNPAGSPGTSPKTYPYPGTVPSLSWDGNNPSTALVWAINTGGYGLWNNATSKATPAKPAVLVAYNAIPTGSPAVLQELWESSTNSANAGPGAVKFSVPTIAGGLVFVAGGTPGYAPGPAGGTGVNCTAAALVNSTTPNVCGGLLSIYGKLHN